MAKQEQFKKRDNYLNKFKRIIKKIKKHQHFRREIKQIREPHNKQNHVLNTNNSKGQSPNVNWIPIIISSNRANRLISE